MQNSSQLIYNSFAVLKVLKFLYLPLTLFNLQSANAREDDTKKNIKFYDDINRLNKNLKARIV